MAKFTDNNDDEQALRRLVSGVGLDVEPRPEWEDSLRLRLEQKIDEAQKPAVRADVRRRMLPRLILTGSAAATAAAVAMWFILGIDTRTATADFAEMLNRVRRAKTVSFQQTVRFPGRPEARAQVLMANPGKVRATWEDGKIQIDDYAGSQNLTIRPAQGTATLSQASEDINRASPLRGLQDCAATAGRFLKKEMWNNQPIMVYQVSQNQGTMKVWVDQRTELPVRIEATQPLSGGQAAVIILDSFCWDYPISPSQFAMDVPAGYVVEQDVSTTDEEALRRLLRVCAEKNGGILPGDLDVSRVMKLVAGKESPAVDLLINGPDATYSDVEIIGDKAKLEFRSCIGGLVHLERLKAERGWTYTGDGVKVGDPAAIIGFWRLTGSDRYKAIYGNLEIREIAAGQLPGR